MSYQKCPVCEGSGISPIPGIYSVIPVCPTCNGGRIISMINGLPPGTVVNINKDEDEPFAKPFSYGVVGELFYKQCVRHAIQKRLADPECTLDDMWNDWVNTKNK